MNAALETSIFDSILGLPVHPLVVHFAVVLLPLAALALILLVISPKLADRYGWLTVLVLAGGVGAAFAAQASGQALALRVGEPTYHAMLGRVVPWVAAGLLVFAISWLIAHKRAFKASGHRSPVSSALAVITALLAILVTVGTLAVGHLGSQAAWEKVMVPQPTPTASVIVSPSPTPSTPASADPSANPSASPVGYTMAEVAQHTDATSCWTVINAQVYDVTSWINQHPGGQDKILALCGKDGTTAFQTQHAGQGDPESTVKQFLIGPLRA